MKTTTLTLAAIALLAIALAPSASATCYYTGPARETVAYLLPCSSFGAGDDAQSAVAFVLEEAGRIGTFGPEEVGRIVAFVVDLVTGIPLP